MMFMMDAQHTGDYNGVSGGIPANNVLKWSTYLGFDGASSASVVDGTVYLGARGCLMALDASTGSQEWDFCKGLATPPAVAGGVIYIGTSKGEIIAIDAASHEEQWVFPAEGWVTAPTVSGGRVYAGTGIPDGPAGRVVALDAATGVQIWEYPLGPGLVTTPAVDAGVVYAGSEDHQVYAISADTGDLQWAFPTDGPVFGAPAVAAGVVYAGSEDGNIYAINADGSLKWSFDTGGAIAATPAVVNGVVYAGNRVAFDVGRVYALDAEDGSEVWEDPFPTVSRVTSSGAAVADGVVYIASAGRLHAIDALDGTERWYYDAEFIFYDCPAVADGRVFLAQEEDTVVYALGNEPPVAVASASPSDGPVYSPVTLDGSGSSDPNADPLAYTWTIRSRPGGSTASVSSPHDEITSFLPDRMGDYEVELGAGDGLATGTTVVSVRAYPTTSSVVADVQGLKDAVLAMDPAVFNNPNNRKALAEKLKAVTASISAGAYADALDKLENDLLRKTDGCALTGEPDRNDWIRGCPAQEMVYPWILYLIQEIQELMAP